MSTINNLPPNVRLPAAHRLPQAVKDGLVAKIRRGLDNSPALVERAVAILYSRQVEAEKLQSRTILDNDLGVQHCHGRRVAYYGRWLASGRHLDGKHLELARKMAHRYAKTQLLEVAALKAGLVRAE